MTYNVNSQSITLELDSNFYDVDDIKSAYNLIKDECVMIIKKVGGGDSLLKIDICPHAKPPKEILDRFLYILSDQQIKSKLSKENGKLRDLIVEHAFKPLENLEEKLDEIQDFSF